MTEFLRKHKIMITFVLIDMFLYWLVFLSGITLPFINPSIQEYQQMINHGTSFPRNTNQILVWIILHAPTSFMIDSIFRNDNLMFLSIIQTVIIAYFIEKNYKKE